MLKERCLKAQPRRKQPWYLDGGCSRHMKGDESLFQKLDRKKSIQITCMLIDHLKKGMHTSLAMNVVENATLLFIVLLKINVLHLRRFGFLKVPMS